jgi:hypothetical protein
VTSFEHETDVATLQKALRLLALENERLVKLNLELRKALAESKGERVEQLELEIAKLQQTVAARNQALFGDSSERRPRPVAAAEPPKPKQTGHGPRKQNLEVVERVHELDVADRTCTSCGGELTEWVGQFEESREIDMVEGSTVRPNGVGSPSPGRQRTGQERAVVTRDRRHEHGLTSKNPVEPGTLKNPVEP